MKRLFLLLLAFMFLTSCAGMSLFPAPPEPYCTPEEQVDSLIYQNFDPDTADFSIALLSAAYLDKNPDKLDKVIEAYEIIRSAVAGGLTYDALLKLVQEELGALTYVVVSKYVTQFKGIKIPIKACDQRLILGHVERQNDIFKMLK